MRKILISGYYGFSNAGDEAMLTAIVTGLRAQDPQVELTVLSGHPELTQSLQQVKSIHRFNALGILRAMWHTDLLLSGGGSLLQNVTSQVSLFYYLSIIGLASLFGKKIMLFAQGIGPIHGRFARWLTHQICQRADLITVRDDGSLNDLKRMGFKESVVHVTSDAVFSLPEGQFAAGKKRLASLGLDLKRPIVGMALRHWKGEDRYIREFAKAADQLSAAYHAQILFVPLQFPADLDLSRRVQAQMKTKDAVFILPAKCSTQGYQDLVRCCHMLIGMRLHALVFAALNNVPFMAVSYDPKVDRFVKGMEGAIAGNINTITSSDIVQAAASLWHKDGRQPSNKIQALHQEAVANLQRALKLLPQSE